VRRVLPFVVAVALVGCNRSQPAPANTSASPATPAATAAPAQAGGDPAPAAATAAQPEAAAKPVPAQLPEVIAKVNGESITKTEFEDAIKSAEQQAGSPVPADQRDRVYREILDQMIGYKLLTQESKAKKVNVPDADVEAQILRIKQQFPTEKEFTAALAQRHMTVAQIRNDARQNMAVSKLVEDAVSSKATVKPEEIQAFYQQNPQNFQESEKVHASHILIAAPKDADAATKAKARAKAESILKDVKAGKDFAALAKAYSEDPGSAPNGGDLGFFPKGQMVPPFEASAFGLKPGSVSDLVETDFGYHIIKVIEKQPGRTVPLEEAKPRIEQYLEAQNREKHTTEFVNGLRAKGKVEVFI
jgi:peptidyl-prolyl cis-trans isomerase C